MTSPYTSNILNNILSSAVSSNNTSVQTANTIDNTDTGFMKALDNSIKSYADKSQSVTNNNYNNPTYAEKTKDVQSAKQQESEPIEKKDSSKPEAQTKETQAASDDIKTDNKKTDEQKTENVKESNEQNKVENNNSNDETSSSKEDTSDNNSQDTETEENTNTTNNNNSAAIAVATESILANIEYSEIEQSSTNNVVSAIETKKEINNTKTQNVDIPMQTTDLIEEAVSNNSETKESNQNQQQTSTINPQNIKSTELPDTEITNSQDLKVEVKTQEKNIQDQISTAQKDTKAALASDNSRIILNLDENTADSNTQTQETAVTPADTEPEKTPVIKVTDDVAASTKENTTANFVENKDFTTSAKQKAVSQMTGVENTDTVVTQTNTQQNTGSESSLNNQNAEEQIIKMNIDDASQPVNSSEAFVNRFDSTFSNTASKLSAGNQTQMLNSNDIMNQINSKLDELQNSGNSKVSIVLKPENLGRVSLEIMNSKDGIVAKMTTDNQQVKELFDKNVEALKSNLSSQGVNVNNIKVECSQESSNNAMNFERDQFNQQNTSHHQNGNGKQTANTSESYTNTNYTEETEFEYSEGAEIKNTETIIQHNGKVDYKV
ncbi:MAG: flagellar hook-length control protein FliK [Clostridium sp.]|nr:flagellar hook-length control protein FliK [Clostridium sp.]